MSSEEYDEQSHGPLKLYYFANQGDEHRLETWKAGFGKALDSVEPHGDFAIIVSPPTTPTPGSKYAMSSYHSRYAPKTPRASRRPTTVT